MQVVNQYAGSTEQRTELKPWNRAKLCAINSIGRNFQNFGLLKCDSAQFGRLAPTFRSDLLPPLSILKTEVADSSVMLVISY